jgi:uncharacterized protein YodC (DUF2158 family)
VRLRKAISKSVRSKDGPVKLLSSDYDKHTGMTEEHWYDESTKRLTIRRLQDVEGTLNDNREQYKSQGNIGYGDSTGGAHKVATIPFVILEKWLREEGFDWFNSTDKERRARLNDPDNKFLLVRPGRL